LHTAPVGRGTGLLALRLQPAIQARGRATAETGKTADAGLGGLAALPERSKELRQCRSARGFHRALAVVLGLVFTAAAHAAPPEPLGVEVTNASEPVLCAEKDNVTVNLTSKDVRRLRIEATHPAYLGSLEPDSFAADWTGCGGAGDPAPSATDRPRRTTLYEDIELWVVGLRFSTFWRAGNAIVRIGDRVETGVHLLQVWRIRPMGGEEVAVLYPQDGYWRLRPMAPAHMAPTAFGSSFLVGPVELEGRPIVKIREVAFDPSSRSFTLAFERGGTARVSLGELDQTRHTLEIQFGSGIEGRPFAAVRSMYVSELNNDVARIAVREPGAKGWREEPIMAFKRATAVELWAGRITPSRHNRSAPDMVLSGFAGAGAASTAPPTK
jgi:hypothetical protein